MIVSWRESRACRVTFSLPYGPNGLADDSPARLAAAAAMNAADAEGIGFTLSAPMVGGWRGEREESYALDFVGITLPPPLVLRALWRAGCAALQVESIDADGYAVREIVERGQ